METKGDSDAGVSPAAEDGRRKLSCGMNTRIAFMLV